jgi:hypothetical protein
VCVERTRARGGWSGSEGEGEEEEQRGVWFFVAGVDNGMVDTVVCGRA